ncbi:MAG: erg26, C-3 sterol dehydrogenase [Bathelium mastoideum]|nr:MAG: erg26, C-3 sterol dehydrogenase [Bathelium mastoideum]
MSNSVLIVGGCGFLGHQIASQALKTGLGGSVSVIDLKITNEVDGVIYYKCDISSPDQIRKHFERIRPDIIIHTASPSPLLEDFALYNRVNVEGTRNLLDAAHELGSVKAFIYTSSASVVWNYRDDLTNVDETAPVLYAPQQPEPYSHTKALAEDLVLNANRSPSPMSTCSLRPSSIFGVGDHLTVMKMAAAAREGKYRVQIGSGKNLFDFTYVDNLVHAHILAAHKLFDSYGQLNPTPKVDGEAFFITNDDPRYFWEFARAIGAAAGYPQEEAKVRTLPAWLGLMIAFATEWLVWLTSGGKKMPTLTVKSIRVSTVQRTFNITKAKRALGYKPQVNIDEAIRRSGLWVKEVEKQSSGKKVK